MAEPVPEEDKVYTIDHGKGVISTVRSHPSGHIITTDHGVTDADGNPKISVHVQTDRSKVPFPAPGTVPEVGI
jgi:hypothetical protein